MPRRGNIPKRVLLPDPVFQSPLVARFINNMMFNIGLCFYLPLDFKYTTFR